MEGLVLCMIVKNEAGIVRRAIRSARPLIAAYVIADTGSTDATLEEIRAELADLPGQLLERPWVDFSTNRNEVLDAAAAWGTHALILDADEELQRLTPAPLRLDPAVDLYWMRERSAQRSLSMRKPRIVRLASGYRFAGVIHEAIRYGDDARHVDLDNLAVLAHYDGARSQIAPRDKYLRDAAVLEAALLKEPDNSRYRYYLAMSYLAASRADLAEAAFSALIAMPAAPAELYDARMRLAALARSAGRLDESAVHARQASRLAPHRADPLVHLSELALGDGEYAIAHALALRALEMPMVEDGMFVDPDVYFPRRQLAFIEAAIVVGDAQRARALIERVLRERTVSDKVRQQFTAWQQRLQSANR